MNAKHHTEVTSAPPAESRWGSLIDWLALLMLLAGSVVWPH